MSRRLRRFLSFLFLLFCCAAASLVSAQSISITFLNDWKEQTSRVLGEGRALLRIVDPGADVSPGPDQVAVSVSSTHTQDVLTTNLVETDPASGIFEGEVPLTSDFYADYLADSEYLVVSDGLSVPMDTVTATYGSVSTSAEAAPSLIDLLDDEGWSPASFAVGERVQVRLRSPSSGAFAGPETAVAVLSSSGGDSETLTLIETGGRTGVFEVSIPLVAGAPAAQDGRLQTAAGETLSVTYADANGVSSSSDTAGVTAASVRFIDREGRPTGLYVEEGEVVVQVVDLAANVDPGTFDSTSVTLSRSTDLESLTLRETGPDTGVFEGRMRMMIGLLTVGNGYLENLNPPATDPVSVAYGSFSDTAQVVRSNTRLLDEAGEDAASVAPGQTLRIQVETAYFLSYHQLDSVPVRVRSLTTGDEETLALYETGSNTRILEGTLPTAYGTAQPGDGLLQMQTAELLQAEHLDTNNIPRSSDQVQVVRSTLRFVDESGQPVSVLLKQGTAHVEVLDLISAGQTPPGASIESSYAADVEPLSLTEMETPGWFEGSMPLTPDWSPLNDGILFTGWGNDRVTARSNGASVVAAAVPAFLEFIDDQGEPMTTAVAGVTLRVRLRAPSLNQSSSQAESDVMLVRAGKTLDWKYLFIAETGPDTAVFEGTLSTGPVQTSPPGSGLLLVEPYDTVTTSLDLPPYGPSNRAAASLRIVPVVLELLAGDGQAASTYLSEETIHLRVSEPAANTSPTSAETIPAQVQAWRRSDSDFDIETVDLTETGPDTGVFTGSLATTTPSFYATPAPGNDVLEIPEIMSPFREITTVTATRSGASDTAVFADSELWLTDAQDQDATSFQIGSSIKVWLRRPRSNSSPGIDTDGVTVRIRTGATDADREWVDLVETGGDTGLFTGLLPTAAASVTFYDDVLSGSPGDLVEAYKTTTGYYVFSFDRGVLVAPLNSPPDAVDDSATTDEDVPVTISVRANDTDPDNDTLTITAVTQGTQGSVTINAGATVTYTPNANANGSYSFTYTVSDGNGGTDTATVTVSITPQNDPPVAVDDTATTDEDTSVTIPVRANDTDPDWDILPIIAATQGTKGTVTINASANVTYTPNANANGSDSFTYTISDGNGGTDTATVTITITPQNDSPVAVDDTATTDEDTPTTISVRANDTDPENDTLTVTAVTQGTKGAVTINSGVTVTYTPNANANGSDSFTYTISDGNGGTDTATVTVSTTPQNDPPVATPDAAATNEDTAVAINVLSNDSDVEGNPLSVSAVTQGAHGTVASNGTVVTYTPAANWNGVDAFTYTVSDGQGGTATAAVSVAVEAVNDAPVATADSGSTRENVSIILSVLANDTDIESNPLTVTSVGTPANGTTSVLPDNTVRYTPPANFTGSATFSYTASDGQGGTGTGQVTVTVGEALERVALLATNSVALRTGSDVLSGDVIVNQASAGPFLNGAELSVGGGVTAASNYDLEGDSVTVASGAVIGSDVRYNQLTNSGTINGQQSSPLALPVFSALPPFLTATPGTTTINVNTNGSQTLAAGSYLDLIVGRKGTVTFTGGTYHFRTIQIDREAKLYFSAASEIRVQQKLSTKNLTTIGPAVGATIDASSILFYVAGLNGTTGALSATPKAVEIGTNNVLNANLYAPNGTIWLQDATQATGAFLGKDVDVAVNAQVQLDSAFSGGQ